MSEETAKVDAAGGSGQAAVTPPLSEEMMGLSPRQQLALQALMAGKNITRAAFAAGVTRQTVHKWKSSEPRFAGAMAAWQMNTMTAAQAQLLEGAEEAVQTIADAVSSGDAYVAMQLLRSLGVMTTSRERTASEKAQPAA